MYEHKLVGHPEIPVAVHPKDANIKDMVLNLIAEQNVELMEEIIELKKALNESVEKLSAEIKDRVENKLKDTKTKTKTTATNTENEPGPPSPPEQSSSGPSTSAAPTPKTFSTRPNYLVTFQPLNLSR